MSVTMAFVCAFVRAQQKKPKCPPALQLFQCVKSRAIIGLSLYTMSGKKEATLFSTINHASLGGFS